ncbi:Uncharacterized protein PCOAH_00046470 [Plasmodium coatneyi]|uniref:Transcription initiation factor IIF subunit alpha n=1 Tax=Plasmodium coatneyi TaxID=208452 RepID=A0A1B1E4E9_9APIC|nr:Uncharacterized protein PCOAH_00046470 [Plasmodium coatneyi]ANQ09810.1 Uncharacterized protein PCOAH_00046470 [Plasmodium coatneyi]
MDEPQEPLKFSDFTQSKHGNKRIRINKPNGDVKYLISRFTDNREISKLSGPVTFISKDLHEESPTSNDKNNNAFYWLLKNSSSGKGKSHHKSYMSKKCNMDTDVFFVLVENEEYSDIYPVSSWHVFEPDLSAKTLSKFNVENPQEKLRAEQNNRRLDDIIERLKSKEEHMKVNSKVREEGNKKKKKKKKIVNSDSSSSSYEDDDLGLKKQEKKRIKNLYKLRMRENHDKIDYVDSALSITALRKSKVNWDYNNDGKKSDDEDINLDDSGQEEFDDDDNNDENDDSDNNSDMDLSRLTTYGQTMKSLLKQQVHDEEDDELKQYSDDDSDEEDDDDEDDEDSDEELEEDDEVDDRTGNMAKKNLAAKKRMLKIEAQRKAKKGVALNKPQKDKRHVQDDEDDEDDDDSDEEEESEDDEEDEEDHYQGDKKISPNKKQPLQNTKANTINEFIKEKIKNKELQIKEENCAKILLKLIEKNNGKMDILTLLDVLNIKEKNQSFLIVQKYIKNLCNISSQTINNRKVKMVSVKPKFVSKK